VSVADIFISRLNELIAAGVPADLDLPGLLDAAKALRDRAERLQQYADDLNARLEREDASGLIESREAHLLNNTLMRLSRMLTHALSTVTGRYDQDSYGLSALEHAVPGLHDAEQLASLSPDTEAYHLLWTRAARQRNRIADALNDGIMAIDSVYEEEVNMRVSP
jgi:hypothetical protein